MMDFSEIEARGLVLLGCGRMGSALLSGWIARGLTPRAATVVEPNPTDWLRAQGVALNEALPEAPAVVVLAVKPQMMGAALPGIARLGGGDTLALSIAAGTPIAAIEAALGAGTPVVRAMPNTPAALGRGISAVVGNAAAGEAGLAVAEGLMSAVGAVVRVETEAQIDAVTAVSGSGPAYVFHLVEALAEAGATEGLAPDLAMRLARATVAGSGYLLDHSEDSAADLRAAVTSPGGTTAAALVHLMDPETGLPPLMRRAVAAARARARELAQ